MTTQIATSPPSFAEREPIRTPAVVDTYIRMAPRRIELAQHGESFVMAGYTGDGSSVGFWLDRHDAARLREIADELEGGAA